MARNKKWKVERHFLFGNHEERIVRATEDNPELFGSVGLHQCLTPGWKQHEFLKPVELDGVHYAHYFYQPNTSKPFTGTIENRLKNIGHSFTMGHQQGLLVGLRDIVGETRQRGLVFGSTYLHDEEYKGHQGNTHWRGIAVCRNVEDGNYDLSEVSLDALCKRYEGISLTEFMCRQQAA